MSIGDLHKWELLEEDSDFDEDSEEDINAKAAEKMDLSSKAAEKMDINSKSAEKIDVNPKSIEVKESNNTPKIKNLAHEFKEIPGLSLLDNAIAIKDEEKIVKYIDKGTWVKVHNSREVQQFGWMYDYHTRSLKDRTEIPNWLLKTAAFLDLPKPENIIINKYEPGEGITAHTDNFCFGNIIASLSLLSPITMDLKFNALEHAIRLEPRSLLTLTGESRHRWTHCIVARKTDTVDGQRILRQKRYSITFNDS
mgnify:CR=1 FL=1